MRRRAGVQTEVLLALALVMGLATLVLTAVFVAHQEAGLRAILGRALLAEARAHGRVLAHERALEVAGAVQAGGEEEVALEQGAAEGDPADLPSPPEFIEGWQLGEPDVVVTMQEDYVLPAEGVDVFRNFVLPIPVSKPRWVKAVELRPGNPRIVHHGLVQVDRSRSSRRLARQGAGCRRLRPSRESMRNTRAPGGPVAMERFW